MIKVMTGEQSNKSGYSWPVFLALAVFGVIDAVYLTWNHFQKTIPPCTIGGCDSVLTSQYAEIFGLPISLLGVGFFLTVIILTGFYLKTGQVRWLKFILVLTTLGLVFSLHLIYLQLMVLNAWCIYCLFSAGSIFGLWIITVKKVVE